MKFRWIVLACILLLTRPSSSSADAGATEQKEKKVHEEECANCALSSKDLLGCCRCELVKYCSKQCQRSHWYAGHKDQCITPEERRPQQVPAVPIKGAPCEEPIKGPADDQSADKPSDESADKPSDVPPSVPKKATRTDPEEYTDSDGSVIYSKPYFDEADLLRSVIPGSHADLRNFIVDPGDDFFTTLAELLGLNSNPVIETYSDGHILEYANGEVRYNPKFRPSAHATGAAEEGAGGGGISAPREVLGDLIDRDDPAMAELLTESDGKKVFASFKSELPDDFVCPCCLESKDASAVASLPCSHHVCQNCVDKLDKCPLCRAAMTPTDKLYTTALIAHSVNNIPKMRSSMIQAANQGSAAALRTLCQMLYIGDGIPVSYSQAFIWCSKAADAGDYESMRFLALLYARGAGVQRNDKLAVLWLTRYYHAIPEPPPFNLHPLREVLKYHKDTYNGRLAFLLAVANIYGIGGEPDTELIVKYLATAASERMGEAYSILGKMFRFGINVKKYVNNAAYLLNMGSFLGSRSALRNAFIHLASQASERELTWHDFRELLLFANPAHLQDASFHVVCINTFQMIRSYKKNGKFDDAFLVESPYQQKDLKDPFIGNLFTTLLSHHAVVAEVIRGFVFNGKNVFGDNPTNAEIWKRLRRMDPDQLNLFLHRMADKCVAADHSSLQDSLTVTELQKLWSPLNLEETVSIFDNMAGYVVENEGPMTDKLLMIGAKHKSGLSQFCYGSRAFDRGIQLKDGLDKEPNPAKREATIQEIKKLFATAKQNLLESAFNGKPFGYFAVALMFSRPGFKAYGLETDDASAAFYLSHVWEAIPRAALRLATLISEGRVPNEYSVLIEDLYGCAARAGIAKAFKLWNKASYGGAEAGFLRMAAQNGCVESFYGATQAYIEDGSYLRSEPILHYVIKMLRRGYKQWQCAVEHSKVILSLPATSSVATDKNVDQALRLLTQAAESKRPSHQTSCFILGTALSDSSRSFYDLELAKQYLGEAAKLGSVQARIALNRLKR